MKVLSALALKAACDRPLNPARADEACRLLGGLARWWLAPEVLEAARASDPTLADRREPIPPPLPDAKGSCWMVCKVGPPLPYLRPAVVLPLCWRQGTPHSDLLPGAIRDLATTILEQARAITPFAERFRGDWGIDPADVLGLTAALADDWFETVDSGWASLAGGLLAAGQDLIPKPNVWSSAAWRGNALARVDGLPEKLGLAVAWGAAEFHVHWSQVSAAEEWVAANAASAGMRVVPIGTPAGSRPWDALRTVVSAYTAEPPVPDAEAGDEAAQFERCANYYLNLPPFSPRSSAFYYSHLLAAIVRRCRKALRDKYPNLVVTHFVTIISPSAELAIMSASALDAKQCLLLHTGGKMEQTAQECVRQLNHGRVATTRMIRETNVVEDVARAVAEFTAGVPPRQVVLDLKPGTKKMSYALIQAAHPENRLLNLEPQFLDDRRNVPGTEIPELLEAISCHR